MKLKIYTLILLSFFAHNLLAQRIGNLDGINYQAVALAANAQEIVGKDIEAKPLFEEEIEVRFTIQKGAADDAVIEYQETANTITDADGLFSLVIGQGTTTGESTYTRLLDIPWIDADQFLKVEIALVGEAFRTVSIEKFQSVPYSFYTDDIADDAITTEKILNEEILAEDISTGAVTSDEILDATIDNVDIADNTIDLTTKVTNQLGVANGGTGLDASTVTDGQVLVGDGTNGNFQLTTLTAGTGVDITNTPGGIEISSPPVGVDSDGSFTIPVGSNGTISAGEAWYSPNSLKVTPSPDKPFVMGDIFLVSADKDLKGVILSAYLQSIDGSGDANVQVILFNPKGTDVTLETPMTFKFLLVK
ncbi:hypothetical protein [Reichenbachiella ulvae]|uniref:Uncharacterized protein n=1 Tax=Reichenbachiella ulvae TaxID=2980104 RepID=A0ABT3CU53_9BACT|nr:hypothetical protein [Reichenbachiella ulvae]MCV9387149.1 hypothetical protein [Reichenbachiella ulvae]